MIKKRYPITMMCAACIPWTDDMQFDEASFRSEVKHLIDHDVKSIYIPLNILDMSLSRLVICRHASNGRKIISNSAML